MSATGPSFRRSIGLSTALGTAGVAVSNLLMIGPPGAGKSLLASCLPGLLPELTPAEALEVSMVQSVARFSFRVTGAKLNKFRKAITYRACALRPTFFCQPSIPRIFG